MVKGSPRATALDLMKELLPADKANRVVEYALDNHLDRDDQIFFFMAMLETIGRLFHRICDEIAAALSALKKAEDATTRLFDVYMGSHRATERVHKELADRVVRLGSDQFHTATKLDESLARITSKIAHLDADIAARQHEWECAKRVLTDDQAVLATNGTFEKWIYTHKMANGHIYAEMVRTMTDAHMSRIYKALAAIGALMLLVLGFMLYIIVRGR